MFDAVSGLETSHLLEQSQLSGIHPFMSAESINLDEVTVSIHLPLFHYYYY